MGVAPTEQRGPSNSGGAANSTANRWLAVEHVRGGDSHEAGRTACAGALAGRDAELVVVFTSDSYDLEALLAGVRSECGDAAVVGCTTAGEISAAGAGDGGVVVTALGGDGFEARTALGRGVPGRLRDAGAAAAGAMTELDPGGRSCALMLFSDGVAGDQQEVIRGIHDVVGSPIPLVGGCAGDGMKMKRTFQLCGDEVVSGGVVGAAIASTGEIGLGWSHGWERKGSPMLVTAATGNRVDEIDDRPALDLYLEVLEAPSEIHFDPQAFTRWARTHPIGLGRRRNGQEAVRCVGEADFESRSIVCTAEVPAGGLAWFMNGDGDSVLRSTAKACRDAIDGLRDDTPLGLITFDCIGRRGVLGDERMADEVEAIAQCAGPAPFAGLYTYGEIARTHGVNALHSQTFVAMAIG
jgi:hypothetical protein